jgi:transaldolase
LKTRIYEITKLGQAIWYDNITRDIITSGKLAKMIDEDGLSGLTSNPTIFDKAIKGTSAYDRDIRSLASKGMSTEGIYQNLVVKDIQMAADVLMPIYEFTSGVNGYVSIEVSPDLAYDSEGTVKAAREIVKQVGRENIMVKVPGTSRSSSAIKQLISEGINVNITLLFSFSQYEQAATSYLDGLIELQKSNQSLDQVASVASFFLSRIDTIIDKQIDQMAKEAKTEKQAKEISSWRGKTALSVAKLVYQRFKKIVSGDKYQRLLAAGARIQRPLWASTSTKDPSYSDVKYLENLIGPNTINTLPEATIAAFRDHGRVAETIEQGVAEAEKTLEKIAEMGINLNEACQKLQEDGVKAFSNSYHASLKSVEEKIKVMALK